ncbi:Dna-directed Rna polymerase I RPA1, partial [Cardiosporidium cionae]
MLNPAARRARSRMLLTGDSNGASPRIVYRHLIDGDVVLMNRQPTLHKPGIMAHFVKILGKEEIFRMNYVNCSSYNADFDGDEMNLHVPQDPLASAEAKYITNADAQYTTVKSGVPLRGLIQDHIQGGTLLTCKDTFLTIDEYQILVYAAVNKFVDQCKTLRVEKFEEEAAGHISSTRMKSLHLTYKMTETFTENISIVIEKPALMKPKRLWTGKQVITSVLKTILNAVTLHQYGDRKAISQFYGINLKSKSKTPGDAWGGCEDGDTEEAVILIQNSELLQGVLDKSQYGASSFGLIHLIYELYGHYAAGLFLNSFARLFTTFLQIKGTTCSPSDFLMTSKGEAD